MLQALDTDLFPSPQSVLDYKEKGHSALMTPRQLSAGYRPRSVHNQVINLPCFKSILTTTCTRRVIVAMTSLSLHCPNS